MNSPGHDKLLGIQFCRGLAAVLVALCHAGRMLALPQYAGHIAMEGFFNFGNAGVDFFFVPLLRLARTRAVLNPMALS